MYIYIHIYTYIYHIWSTYIHTYVCTPYMIYAEYILGNFEESLGGHQQVIIVVITVVILVVILVVINTYIQLYTYVCTASADCVGAHCVWDDIYICVGADFVRVM